MTLRIAWLTTGRGAGSYGALEYALDAIDEGLPVEIAVVFVNREPGDFEATDGLIALAERRGVAVETLSSVAFRKEHGGKRSKPGEALPQWRMEYDGEVARRLGTYRFDLAVMFGYMLIATEPLYSAFPIINDHPALPDGPVGTYQEVICELIRAGASETGCMMNVVTGDVDRGPVVSLCRYGIGDESLSRAWAEARDVVRVRGEQQVMENTTLYATIRQRGIERERPFLVETLRAVAEGRLEVPPKQPIDLTRRVEAALARTATL